MKIFVIRDHKRFRKEKQRKDALEFGATPLRTWVLGNKRDQHSISDVVTAATNGDEVGVSHLWLLPEATSKVKGRDEMCNAVERLLAKGCSITETSTGRTCTGGAELAAMIKDASNVLAGNAKNPGGKPGPDKVQVYTDDEVQTIGDIWQRKDMRNDPMRIAEVRARGGVFSKITVTGWYRDVKPRLAELNETE